MAAARRLRQRKETAAQSATAGDYITPFGTARSGFVRSHCVADWHEACVYFEQTAHFDGPGEIQAIPMATSVLWHGSQTEALELLQALSRNCSCVVTAEGVRLSTCAPHQMLSSDQRAIDGLLFARRIADRLRSEEFDPATTSVSA
jgi:hypothetical protein